MLSFDTFRSWPNCKVIALHLQYTRRKKPNLEPILHSIDKQSEQFTNCLKKNSRFRTLEERKILLLYLTTRVQISVIVEIAYGGTAALNKATCWPRAYLQHRSLCNSIDFQKKKPKEFCVSQNTYWRARRKRKLVFCLSLRRSKNTKATKLSMCTVLAELLVNPLLNTCVNTFIFHKNTLNKPNSPHHAEQWTLFKEKIRYSTSFL